jgi:uncharacterized low-complexity protein
MKTERKNNMTKVGILASGLAIASLSASAFAVTPIGSGGELRNELTATEMASNTVNASLEFKNNEAKCGESKTAESKCGEKGKTKEAKCGEKGKEGEAKCGEKGKGKEAKCGEKGKEGEAKCGEK